MELRWCSQERVCCASMRIWVWTRHGGACLKSQHWRNGERWIPVAHWPASLAWSVSSRPTSDPDSKQGGLYLSNSTQSCVQSSVLEYTQTHTQKHTWDDCVTRLTNFTIGGIVLTIRALWLLLDKITCTFN